MSQEIIETLLELIRQFLFILIAAPGRLGGNKPPFPPQNRTPKNGAGNDSFPSYGSSPTKALLFQKEPDNKSIYFFVTLAS